MVWSAMERTSNRTAAAGNCDVKYRDQENNERHAGCGRKIVPMSRDEQQHSGAEEYCAEGYSENHRPPQTSVIRGLSFKRADAGGCFGIEE
jgi:hypothetical protein